MTLARDLRSGRHAIEAWVVSRALVVGALAVSRHVVDHVGAVRPEQLAQGLRAWDAAFYIDIARSGYDGVAEEGLRFFPLLPLLGRFAAWITPFDATAGVIVVANLASLAFFLRLYGFVRRETGRARDAVRAVWIAALAPPAFVLVMGYAESLFLLCSVSAIDNVRRRHWWRAVPWAAAAGLARPTGVLLAIPFVIEAWQTRRDRAGDATRAHLGPIAAIAAAPIGLLSFLLWARDRTGSLLEPLRIHTRSTLRGGSIDPFSSVWHALQDLRSPDRIGSGLHFVTAIVIVALLVVLWRRAPRSLFAYGLASAVLALSAENLDSLERYALATVPFILAGALVLHSDTRERTGLVIAGSGIVGMSFLAFTGALVP